MTSVRRFESFSKPDNDSNITSSRLRPFRFRVSITPCPAYTPSADEKPFSRAEIFSPGYFTHCSGVPGPARQHRFQSAQTLAGGVDRRLRAGRKTFSSLARQVAATRKAGTIERPGRHRPARAHLPGLAFHSAESLVDSNWAARFDTRAQRSVRLLAAAVPALSSRNQNRRPHSSRLLGHVFIPDFVSTRRGHNGRLVDFTSFDGRGDVAGEH